MTSHETISPHRTGSLINDAGSSNHCCLKWSNFSVHLEETLNQLLKTQSLVDITLCAGGKKIYAHKAVLCAYSSYFKGILSQVDDPHPTVILSEISAQDVEGILEFLYCGELKLDAYQVSEVLSLAESWQIRTLMEVRSHLNSFNLPKEKQPLTKTCIKNHSKISSTKIHNADSVEESSTKQHSTNNHKISLLEYSAREIIAAPGEMQEDVTIGDTNTFQNESNQAQNTINLDRDALLEDNSSERDIEHFDPDVYCQNIHFESEEIVGQEISIGTSFSDNQHAEVRKGKSSALESKKRKRTEKGRRGYSAASMENALANLRAGRSLGATALAHKIPRSTLYVRAKEAGVYINFMRQEYSAEKIQAAVDAVAGGATLQKAASLYQIPKTVIWRRVQVARCRQPVRQNQVYGFARRQAAVEALQNGQTLSQVADQFKIPKTTLYREKTRLMESGKLQCSSSRRKGSTDLISKNTRLSKAVTACQEGKMSSAVASATFQIPKTTIWRRLKKKSHNVDMPDSETNPESPSSFTFCEESGPVPLAYIVDGTDFSETPIII